MIAVFTVLLVLAVSLTVIRVAAAALTLTGISKDLAQFQALSAFTGSGFTTKESEEIVNHPVRRRIVMHLMLLGNAGIIVVIASVLRLVLETGGDDIDWYDAFWFRVVILLLGVWLLWVVANSPSVEKIIYKANAWAMRRWSSIEVRDYTSLFHFADDYGVSELRVHEGDWLAGHLLQDLKLSSEGVLVLGIERKGGHYVGTPRGETLVEAGDCLVMYGRQETLDELHSRSEGMLGNMRHVMAVTKQADLREQEARETGQVVQEIEK